MSKEYRIRVAGWDHRQRALSSLMTEKNYEYKCTKKELIDSFGFDDEERIYEYEPASCVLEIRPEPDNPYDPNALQVIADDVFIGYVPKDRQSDLKKILSAPGLRGRVEITGGKYKYLEYDSDADYLCEMKPKYYTLHTEKSPFRAEMIFTIDNQ